jgi:hypothetical protein
MRMTWPNIWVQATPVGASRDFLRQVSGAPDPRRWLNAHTKKMNAHTAVCFSVLLAVVIASAGEAPIIGPLGKPVGTELTIEGTFQAGKNSWVLVTTVDGQKLTHPVLVSTCNLDPLAHIPTNAVCRFKGKEITYVVKAVVDPKTGRELQQASPGRHFDFEVARVLAPKGLKTRDEVKQTQPTSR